MHSSVFVMEKLRKAGFSFGEDEHLLYPGTVYFYKGKEYIIGGFEKPVFNSNEILEFSYENVYSDIDITVSSKGTRLATVDDLLWYIELNSYSFNLKYSTEDRYFYADFIGDNGHSFSSSGPSFIAFLEKSVLKIARYINMGR